MLWAKVSDYENLVAAVGGRVHDNNDHHLQGIHLHGKLAKVTRERHSHLPFRGERHMR